jgi:hypothetical protein
MATTTPNYGWPVPTSTDYVKDGATAIEALGDAIDATVFTLPKGLTLIKTQTIGTAVSSVAVTSAFSSTYDAYRVIVDGGVGSTASNLSLTLTGSTTGYYSGCVEAEYAGVTRGVFNNNAAAWTVFGAMNTSYINADFEVIGVAAARFTRFSSNFINNGSSFKPMGIHQVATAYTGFTITPTSGTMTGGTIRVYGYVNS